MNDDELHLTVASSSSCSRRALVTEIVVKRVCASFVCSDNNTVRVLSQLLNWPEKKKEEDQ